MGTDSLFEPSQEHVLLRQTVRDFAREQVEPQALESDRQERFNLDLFRQLGNLGLLGISVPERYGGAGMDAVAAVIVHEELSAVDPGLCLAYLAHAMLFVNNFCRNANDAQRRRYLEKVMSGEWVGGMCMTEPSAGTDVLGMKSQAVRRGDMYYLNGRKMFITNGAVDDTTLGDIFLVYAKTDQGLSSFVVEKDFPGFSLGQRLHGKTGMRASMTAELVFEDCAVPAENRLGQEGESLLHMMRNLEIERVTIAAMSTGIAARCVEVMTRYASERTAYGEPINSFGQVQRYIADSYAQYMAARTYVYHTAARMNLDSPGQRIDSDGVKLVATTMAKQVADNAMQVLGGYGYFSEYVVERLWRDAKLLEIGGGTLEAHQKNITKDLTRRMDAIR
ncbi:MAG: acyl-CoA dehydrogenase family protein [Desulfurellaceae bacterium]|nr:acyl-CoA dehydrogenase family protein [Desulfurellaceae bacterium]